MIHSLVEKKIPRYSFLKHLHNFFQLRSISISGLNNLLYIRPNSSLYNVITCIFKQTPCYVYLNNSRLLLKPIAGKKKKKNYPNLPKKNTMGNKIKLT